MRLSQPLMQTDNRHTIDINGTGVYYESMGTGQPLVLIHAGIGDSRMWDDQFAAFARTYQVIRYDVRGYGKTPRPSSPFSTVDDLYKLLLALKLNPVYLLGLSMGGGIAIDFTLTHPDMVAALIAVAPALSGYNPPDTYREVWEEMELAYNAGDFERVVEMETRVWVDGPNRRPDQVDPHVRARMKMMQTDLIVNHTEQGEPLGIEPPAVGRLSEIKVPTLLIAGDGDVPYMLDIVNDIEVGISGSKKVIMAGPAHVPHMEKPQEFNQIVFDFLKTVESPTAKSA